MTRRVHPVSIAVLVGSLTVVLVATLGAWVAFGDTEHELLDQRTSEAGAVLAQLINGIQTPFAAAAEVAESADGSVAPVRAVLDNAVGPGLPFTSVAVFAVGREEPLLQLGEPPLLFDASPERTEAALPAERMEAEAAEPPLSART